MTTTSTSPNGTFLVRLFSFLFLGLVLAISAFAFLTPGASATNTGETELATPLNELWVLVCAALVFLMQGGFLCYEVGLARPAHTTSVAIKNLVDWAIGTLGFVSVGFALMFGLSSGGFFGTSYLFLDGLTDAATSVSGITFMLFQLAFAGTAITLVSGSLVERTSLLAYGMIAAWLAVVVYPVYGHWVWGNLLEGGNTPWLASLGFHDFAGGTVVHLLGATVAYVGIKMIGPRIGRFDSNGQPKEMEASNIGMTMLGVIILWFGWWGFNGGSFLTFGLNAGYAILVTNLAAVAGLVGAGAFAYLFQNRYMLTMKLVGGAISGLVSITPGADVVGLAGAAALGLIAGAVFSWGNDYLLRQQVDDALGIIPAHGGGAIVGTLGLVFFAADGTFEGGIINQITVQLAGVVLCVVWAAGASYPIYWIIKRLSLIHI